MNNRFIYVFGIVAVIVWPSTTVFAVTANCMEPAKGSDEHEMVDALDDAINGHNSGDQHETGSYMKDNIHIERPNHEIGKASIKTTTKAEYEGWNTKDWKKFSGHKASNRCVKNISKASSTEATLDITYDFEWNNCNRVSKQPMKGTLSLVKESTGKWFMKNMVVDRAGPTVNDCPDEKTSQTGSMQRQFGK